jgi:hypothetical protein
MFRDVLRPEKCQYGKAKKKGVKSQYWLVPGEGYGFQTKET